MITMDELKVLLHQLNISGECPLMVENLRLSEGPRNFNSIPVYNFALENRTTDPANPVNGQIWLRTDL